MAPVHRRLVRLLVRVDVRLLCDGKGGLAVAVGRTHWKCEVCGWEGTVEYPKDADVHTVVHLIEDAHVNDDHQEFDLAKITVKEL